MAANDWMPGARHHDMSRSRGNGRFNAMNPMRGYVLHVNDVYGDTSASWFIAGGGNDSVCPNFQVYRDGTIWQFLPGAWRPWCQRNGNDAYGAIETGGKSSQPFTRQQMASVARILAWLHQHHGLHLQAANHPGDRGLGTHRMGGGSWGGHDCPGSIRTGERGPLLRMAQTIANPYPASPPRKPAPVVHRPLSDAQLCHELSLTAHQLHNARGIVAAANAHPKFRANPRRAAQIAIETALTESGMRVLASANVPSSVRYPHDRLSWTWDGLGHDHASCGMFQQQTGYRYARPGTSTMGSPVGWGTPAQLMDPQKSTALFLNSLAHVWWTKLTRWAAAQAVQRSAFADGRNYRGEDSRAIRIEAALHSPTAPHAPAAKHAVPKPGKKPGRKIGKTPAPDYVTVTVHRGDTLSSIAGRHHTSWQVLAKLNNLRNPNLIQIGQRLRVPA